MNPLHDRIANPAMLTLGRESRGLTQKDLSNQVNISQAKISKYENGMLQVSSDDLIRLSRSLGFTCEFFYQTHTIYGLGSSFLFHRRRQSIPMKRQRQMLAHINILRMQAERLLKTVEFRHENLFEEFDIDAFEGDAEEIARQVRARWKLPPGPVQSMTTVIESFGGLIFECDFGTRLMDGAHLRVAGLPPLFFVNSESPGDRHRFNLAHELGHAIMHVNGIGDLESEANRFAAEFLMPREEISKHLCGITLERAARLKSHWKVSMQAIIRRARDLGRITDRQYRDLMTKISARGYRTVEPIAIPYEEPILVRQLIAVHRDELHYSDGDLSDLLFEVRPQLLEDDEPMSLIAPAPPLRIAE